MNKFLEALLWMIGLILFYGVIGYFLSPSKSEAKELGEIGKSWDIAELDVLSDIYSKLEQMRQRGEIAEHERKIAEKVKESVENPKAVSGIKHTEKERSFEYNPVYVVERDLKDVKGQIFAKKGDRINPFEYVTLPYELVFFDGSDQDHIDWAIGRYNQAKIKPKLILVAGSVLRLEQEYDVEIYFDQEGIITKKLGIKQVPAIVYQAGDKLNIKEIDVKRAR